VEKWKAKWKGDGGNSDQNWPNPRTRAREAILRGNGGNVEKSCLSCSHFHVSTFPPLSLISATETDAPSQTAPAGCRQMRGPGPASGDATAFAGCCHRTTPGSFQTDRDYFSPPRRSWGGNGENRGGATFWGWRICGGCCRNKHASLGNFSPSPGGRAEIARHGARLVWAVGPYRSFTGFQF
jgi:hypothetical protein